MRGRRDGQSLIVLSEDNDMAILAWRRHMCSIGHRHHDRLTQPPSPSGLQTPRPGPSAAPSPRDVVSARHSTVRRSAGMRTARTKLVDDTFTAFVLSTTGPAGSRPRLVIDDEPRPGHAFPTEAVE